MRAKVGLKSNHALASTDRYIPLYKNGITFPNDSPLYSLHICTIILTRQPRENLVSQANKKIIPGDAL